MRTTTTGVRVAIADNENTGQASSGRTIATSKGALPISPVSAAATTPTTRAGRTAMGCGPSRHLVKR